MGTQLPLKGAQLPQFSAHDCCGQMAGWIKMPLSIEVGLGPGDFVSLSYMRTQLPSQKRGHSPHQFSAHVYCGQMAGCIMIPLGTEVALGRGDIVLDGAQLPLQNDHSPSPKKCFDPCLFWPNGRPSQLLLSSCWKSSPMCFCGNVRFPVKSLYGIFIVVTVYCTL